LHVIADIAVLLLSGSQASNSNGSGLLYYAKAVWSFVFSNWSNIVKITLALATLLSTGGVLGGRFGWLQRFIAPKRRSDLVEQIGKLAESMSKLHELPEWTGDLNAEIKAALKTEMEMKLSELRKLQQTVKWEHSGGWSVKSWLKYSFLWWRPRAFGAWCFHLSYHLMLALVGITSLIFLTEILSPTPGTHIDSADVTIAITLYTILGVPAMVLRFFAAKIYRRQCDESLRKCEAQPA
jgi:hypothetical protein